MSEAPTQIKVRYAENGREEWVHWRRALFLAHSGQLTLTRDVPVRGSEDFDIQYWREEFNLLYELIQRNPREQFKERQNIFAEGEKDMLENILFPIFQSNENGFIAKDKLILRIKLHPKYREWQDDSVRRRLSNLYSAGQLEQKLSSSEVCYRLKPEVYQMLGLKA